MSKFKIAGLWFIEFNAFHDGVVSSRIHHELEGLQGIPKDHSILYLQPDGPDPAVQ
jgi:hypothetical protein